MLSFKQFMSEVLDATQRRKFAMKMKKNKTRIAMGRKRAERKIELLKKFFRSVHVAKQEKR